MMLKKLKLNFENGDGRPDQGPFRLRYPNEEIVTRCPQEAEERQHAREACYPRQGEDGTKPD